MILFWALVLLFAESWEVHYTQGRALAQRGDWKQAESEFRQVVGERPGFVPGRLALGTVLEQREDWTGAEAQFREALALDSKSTYAMAQIAQSLMKLQRSTAAIQFWKQAISLEPANADFATGLAAAQFDAADINGAQQTLLIFANTHPESAAAFFSLGNLFARRGLFAEAADAYRACLKLDASNDEARLAMVKALLATDHHHEALEALQGRREDFDTFLLRGGAYRGMGDDEHAVTNLTEAVRLRPGDYDARYNLGFVLFRMGKALEAKDQLERARQIKPDSAEARYRLALVLKSLNDARATDEMRQFEQKKKESLQQTISATSMANAKEVLKNGDVAGAIAQYQEAIRLNPRNALAHNQLGLLFSQQGKVAEAQKEFEAGYAADPKCAECQSNLGVIYGQTGDSKRAEQLFRSALEINPKYDDARLNLGLMLAGESKFAEAEKELRLVPETARSLTGLGMVQTKLGEAEAIDTFRKVVLLSPGSPDARLNLGIALADAEKPELALTEFTEAVRLAPRDPVAHYNRGRALKDLGRLQEAAAEFEAAAPLTEALFLNAIVQQQLEHRDRAIVLLHAVLGKEPRNVRAWFLLGQNLQQTGKESEAIAAWKRALEVDPNHTESLYALFRSLAKSQPEESKAFEARFIALKQQNQAVGRAETLSNFALASVASKDWTKAIAQMHEALEVCGDCVSKADLQKNLGLIECQSGDLANGERDLRISLKDKPNDPDIVKALQIIDDLRKAPPH